MSALSGVQPGVVEGVREELVDEGAEGHAAAPAGGEVLDVHVLRAGRPEQASVSLGPRGPGSARSGPPACSDPALWPWGKSGHW